MNKSFVVGNNAHGCIMRFRDWIFSYTNQPTSLISQKEVKFTWELCFYFTLIKKWTKSDPKQKQIFKNFTHFRFLPIISSTSSYIHLTNKQSHKKDYFNNIRRVQEPLLTSSQWCMKASSFFVCFHSPFRKWSHLPNPFSLPTTQRVYYNHSIH